MMRQIKQVLSRIQEILFDYTKINVAIVLSKNVNGDNRINEKIFKKVTTNNCLKKNCKIRMFIIK